MSRKSRLAEKIKEQEKRKLENWKKQKYSQMAREGMLGNKEQEKYFAILNELYASKCDKEELSGYNVEIPTKAYYDKIRILERKYLTN